MVEAGWKGKLSAICRVACGPSIVSDRLLVVPGTNLAAYETDFYHNLVASTPQYRQVFGAGEMFLNGIHLARD